MILDILVTSEKEEPKNSPGMSRETRVLSMSAMSSVVVDPTGLTWQHICPTYNTSSATSIHTSNETSDSSGGWQFCFVLG
jgi:hypothetical protein